MNENLNYLNRSSINDLRLLADQMGIPNLTIIERSKLSAAMRNKHIKRIIVNYTDAPGTHWIAVDKVKKMFFDSYAQPPPQGIPKSYKRSSHNKELQSIESSNCGQLSILFLYFSAFI